MIKKIIGISLILIKMNCNSIPALDTRKTEVQSLIGKYYIVEEHYQSLEKILATDSEIDFHENGIFHSSSPKTICYKGQWRLLSDKKLVIYCDNKSILDINFNLDESLNSPFGSINEFKKIQIKSIDLEFENQRLGNKITFVKQQKEFKEYFNSILNELKILENEIANLELVSECKNGYGVVFFEDQNYTTDLNVKQKCLTDEINIFNQNLTSLNSFSKYIEFDEKLDKIRESAFIIKNKNNNFKIIENQSKESFEKNRIYFTDLDKIFDLMDLSEEAYQSAQSIKSKRIKEKAENLAISLFPIGKTITFSKECPAKRIAERIITISCYFSKRKEFEVFPKKIEFRFQAESDIGIYPLENRTKDRISQIIEENKLNELTLKIVGGSKSFNQLNKHVSISAHSVQIDVQIINIK
ncbi:hypothetical protein LEP1GSC202_2225 [Leptospira yanagawae serovar Saopaulo str. Sao Paulo = ATCC 700523]|uniref:Uncharacterized protein n=1 Tax=Leptospira yanagawae serovar Saopaulo str. Sao Paulo = ATCC 700523 TaxID=1249483 RepID=A0A5E8HIR9_9LEPT|nr:hypothetical protein [Leptospira yanagawae]EOQ90797.1 hypothetical protein LEP1GSC202_2225 [Leptospira yanagawae serovar Saopaulo str. Sao Paulo = ATCC 700523]